MAAGVDAQFYKRADAVIRLANSRLVGLSRGKVSASCMYATARSNSWVSATGFSSSEEMSGAKAETLDYFVTQYRAMLEENYQDYVDNFAKYMQPQES